MSRKYCEVCGARHNNQGLGLCDAHLETPHDREREVERQFQEFMALPEEDKWREILSVIRNLQ